MHLMRKRVLTEEQRKRRQAYARVYNAVRRAHPWDRRRLLKLFWKPEQVA